MWANHIQNFLLFIEGIFNLSLPNRTLYSEVIAKEMQFSTINIWILKSLPHCLLRRPQTNVQDVYRVTILCGRRNVSRARSSFSMTYSLLKSRKFPVSIYFVLRCCQSSKRIPFARHANNSFVSLCAQTVTSPVLSPTFGSLHLAISVLKILDKNAIRCY